MKQKLKISALLLIFIFGVQLISMTTALSHQYTEVRESEQLRTAQQERLRSEDLEILIGIPNQIDVNDRISIYTAGIRNARATYVTPLSVEIRLLTRSLNDDNRRDESVLVTSRGELTYTEEWVSITNPEIERIGEGHLYHVTFSPYGSSARLTVQVTMEWITPWGEILTSQNEKSFRINEWYDLDSKLATEGAEVQGNLEELNSQRSNFDDLSNDLAKEMDELIKEANRLRDMIFLDPDPANFHFYLLNITTIIDPREGSNSYLDHLRQTDEVKYNEYVNILTEVNEAFIESLEYLDRRNIDYKITHVNYTYSASNFSRTLDATLDEFGFYDFDYTFDTPDEFGNYHPVDADASNENLETTSFEFLLEGKYWTGHPEFIRTDRQILLEGLDNNQWYDIQNGFQIINVEEPTLVHDAIAVDPINCTSEFLIYDGCYGQGFNEYNLIEILGEEYSEEDISQLLEEENMNLFHIEDDILIAYEEFEIEIHENNREFRFTQDLEVYNFTSTLAIKVPGGWRKSDRAIVVNLMHDLFPMLSRMYCSVQTLSNLHLESGVRLPEGGRGAHPDYNATYDGFNEEFQFYLNPENPDLIETPITRSFLDTRGEFRVHEDQNDIHHMPRFYVMEDGSLNEDHYLPDTNDYRTTTTYSLFNYMMNLQGFFDNEMFYVNPISAPVNNFITAQNAATSDRYDLYYSSSNFTQYVADVLDLIEDDDLTLHEDVELSLFALVDIFNKLTIDTAGGSVIPYQRDGESSFYKTLAAKWIEAEFNGTMELGKPKNHGSPDYASLYPGAYTFYSPAKDITEFDEYTRFEYSITPFEGPDDFPPLGIMIASSSNLIQNSFHNLTMGFGYCWGMIILIYYHIYRKSDAILQQLIRRNSRYINELEQNEELSEEDELEIELKTEGIRLMQADQGFLMKGWKARNFSVLHDTNEKIIDYLNNPNNPYTSVNGETLLSRQIRDTYSTAETMLELVREMGLEGKKIDNEMDKLGDDVPRLGLFGEIEGWIENHIIPLLGEINGTIYHFLKEWEDSFDTAVGTFEGKVSTVINNTRDAFIDFTFCVGNLNDQIANKIEDIMANVTRSLDEGIDAFLDGLAAFERFTFTAVGGLIGALLGYGIASSASLNIIGSTVLMCLLGGLIANIAFGGIFGAEDAEGYDILGMNHRPEGIVTQHAGNALHTFKTAFTRVRTSIQGATDAISSSIGGVITSIRTAGETAFDVLHGMISHTSKAIRHVSGAAFAAFNEIRSAFINTVYAMLDMIKLILSSVESTLSFVLEIFNRIIDQTSFLLDQVRQQIDFIGETVVDIIGFGVEQLSNTIGTSIEVMENLRNTFIENTVAFLRFDHLGDILSNTIGNLAIINYVTSFFQDSEEYEVPQMTEDNLLRLGEVLTDIGTIRSTDYGFYIYQMGDEFTEKLYYIFEYKGERINPDLEEFSIQKYAHLQAEGFNDTAHEKSRQILKTNIVMVEYQYENVDYDGIYYVDFFEGRTFDWFKDFDMEGVPDYTDIPAPEGWYLTTTNATYQPSELNHPVGTILATPTSLYHSRHILDAFPVINLRNIDPDERVEITAGGAPVPIELGIQNLMWSQPFVSVEFQLATESGIPITNFRYESFQLNTEAGGEVTKIFNWAVSGFSPAGDYDLIVSVVEYNGDRTFRVIPVRIIQQNPILHVFLTYWYLIVFALAGVGALYYYFNVHKRQQMEAEITRFELRI